MLIYFIMARWVMSHFSATFVSDRKRFCHRRRLRKNYSTLLYSLDINESVSEKRKCNLLLLYSLIQSIHTKGITIKGYHVILASSEIVLLNLEKNSIKKFFKKIMDLTTSSKWDWWEWRHQKITQSCEENA